MSEDQPEPQDEGLDSISPYDQVVRQNLMHMRLSRTHVILDGEWCAWREDKDCGIVIKREPWSLLGTGRTLNEAIDDFRREAGAFATIMKDDKFEEVTEEAWRMRDFVMRYLPRNVQFQDVLPLRDQRRSKTQGIQGE